MDSHSFLSRIAGSYCSIRLLLASSSASQSLSTVHRAMLWPASGLVATGHKRNLRQWSGDLIEMLILDLRRRGNPTNNAIAGQTLLSL
ncbi:uncharacterized protein LAESUDRAFT_557684 [Laetiporus sulphureus 93-53]|uniref:Uncharacterized protein n=1 Tax=Laetiporus sulphureus 93-53 TaxID=1314785 RepID=A0A165B676_9APHY|nr:uncharacterized protein LAESUDRAFT_557684 [Laetiporus sulphureus 93-53]KZT00331.1 hypothetical protein LAESUDRAFT_557684 [Laetiporus sulphureus 93-53]